VSRNLKEDSNFKAALRNATTREQICELLDKLDR